jgi:hypothetical protein
VLKRVLIIAMLCVVGAPNALAASKSVHPPLVTGAIILDGKMNEEGWSTAVPLTNFSVFRPRTDVPARFGSSARIMRDNEALYVFVTVQSKREDLHAPMSKRDGDTEGDNIEIMVDSLSSGQRAYGFRVGAGGVLSDGLVSVEPGNVDPAWDSLFDAQTHIGDDAWSAEVRIPFRSLRFEKSSKAWGLHVLVKSWKHQQTLSWMNIDRNKNNFVAQAGQLTGLDDVEPGRAFELLPTLTLGWGEDAESPSPTCSFDAGFGQFQICGANLATSLSGKWAITPSLTMDVSLFPDFSQLGADAAQLTVNNRYALYLHERRPFFVEGKEIFDTPFSIFYSRSIGQPEAALKVSGAVGSARVGALVAWDSAPAESVLDDEFSEESLEEDEKGKVQTLVSMARGQMLLGSMGNVGAIFVDKEYLMDGTRRAHNQVVGLDSTLLLTDQLRLEAAGFYSNANSLLKTQLDGYAVHTRAVYKEDHFRFQSHYRHLSDEFRSEAGYIPRVNYHDVFTKFDWYHRSEDPWARKVSPGVWAQAFLDDNGEVNERILGANTFWQFGGRVWLLAQYDRVAERVDGSWLDGNHYSFRGGFGPYKLFTFRWYMDFGDSIIREELLEPNESAYLGYHLSPKLEVTVRPTPRWILSARYAQRFVRKGNTSTELSNQSIVRLSTRYFFLRHLDLLYNLEWERIHNHVDGSASDHLTNELLLSWEPNPGKVLFVGYRETTSLEPFVSLEDRQIFLKFNWLFSL